LPELFTLTQAARMLGISRRALYGWLRDANITTRILPTDKRAQTLTRAQIERLAKAHSTAIKDESLLARLEQVEARLEALETWRQEQEARPSAPVTPIYPPARDIRTSAPAARFAEAVPLPVGALTKAEASRLVEARHGATFATVKQWPWPPSALASANAALAWALSYVAGTTRQKPTGWRWRCNVADCPCQQEASSAE